VTVFLISSDSSRVVYRADQDTGGVYELYSVSIVGTNRVKLNGTLATNGNVSTFQISLDSGRVVYEADQDTAGVHEIYSVPIEGPASSGVKLNGSLVANGNVSSFQIIPNSKNVI
jgi:Tol biopolymer transport system component